MQKLDTTSEQEAKQSTFSHFKRWLGSGLAPKLSFSIGSLAVATALVFGISTLVTTPLTAERVLAEAATAYEKSPDGRYRYSKTREINMLGNKEQIQHVTISESWEDTQSDTSRYQSSLEDGTLLNKTITIDGKFYDYFNEAAFQELYGTPEDLVVSDFELDSVIPGASAAGLTFDDFQSLAPIEIDQRLVDAGQETYFDKIFGTTDFPGYTLTGGEVEELGFEQYDELFPEEVSIYVDGEWIDPNDPGAFPEPDFDESALEEEALFYGQIEKIRSENNTEKRQELISQLKTSDNIELVDEQEWYGKTVVGITHSISPFDGFTTRSTTYFDAKTFRIVGNEYTNTTEESGEDNNFFFGEDSTFVQIILEESYSDVMPDFSTDGLQSLDFEKDYSEDEFDSESIPVEIEGGIGN